MKYTTELIEKLIADYEAGVPVSEMSERYDAPVKSIVAKLSHLGVYKRKAYATKNGGTPRKKIDFIDSLAELMGVDAERLESLEKANKSVLILLEEALQ